MRFSVTKLAQAMVPPYEATPTGNLPLSSMDRNPRGLRYLYDSIHVFGHGDEPAKVIREALSRALVPYYPVAGRIVDSHQGEPEVACTGDGVWFVEASVNCNLGDVNHLERPLMIPKQALLPCPSPETKEKDAILLVQVTGFTCGGFALGIRFNHAFFDGIGVGQFLKAVAEIAKGLSRPAVEPIWCREAIPNPPKLCKDPELLITAPLELLVMDLSLDRVHQMQSQLTKETARTCTKFEVLTAKVWQSLIRAINLDPHVEVCLVFTANVRHLMHQILPPEGGYYGNCMYRATATATRGKIMNSSLGEIVSLIQEAKEELPTRFSKWLMGDPEADPFRVPLRYGSLWVTDWTRVGFFELDFAWGRPLHVVPLSDSEFVPLCFMLKPPADKQSARLMTRCAAKEHLSRFHDEINLI
ncbi:myricetin 3-O-glucosyl 1,2-rhamnoside 6'-O-caffeoyltransferase AT2-like isoform X2 [Phoenix dactylifera]|uniref:Myricetin 3-O-glucosyl 1,2-rhamnoside 6'-O-caffeoyltransferase AT2-like isoform X2 n=1 Tax=Phoenix dactylifera TaxID=42345 RepID=A0A8B9AEP4_PHODC|nr:myricetin 3-O-glucosyl 1,2-rhamnoside 6'-O-caffeoyltransferase AT2-like isoform X2 [Phoenix dactylifera]